MAPADASPLPQSPPPADEPTLGDLFAGMWRQRLAIVLIIGSALALAAASLGLLLALGARAETSVIPFRLRFAGALDGRYPNGMPFQPADITAASVVRPVVERLNLERFAPYEDLKAAINVVEFSEALELLQREFAAKLSNSRLTQSERSALEAEYSSRRRAARSGEFRLLLQRDVAKLPTNEAAAFLLAVLNAWAAEAQEQRGAWTYDLAIPGPALINEETLAREDYLVAVDMVRAVLRRIAQAADQLAAVPGASLVRAPGANGLSLVELRARLDDLLRFKVEPLFGRIRSIGVFRERLATTIYLRDQLFRLGIEAKALQDKANAIDEVLSTLRSPITGDGQRRIDGGGMGSAIIPQFGEGFLDRLMDLGVQTADVDYRRELAERRIAFRSELVDISSDQAVYQELLDSLTKGEGVGGLSAEEYAVATKLVEDRFQEISAEAKGLLKELQGLHVELSRQNLRPESVYAVTGPVLNERSGLSMRLVAGIVAGFGFLGVFVALIVAILRERARRSA